LLQQVQEKHKLYYDEEVLSVEKSNKNTIIAAAWILGAVLLVISVTLFIISITTHLESLRIPSIVLSLIATGLGLVRAIIR
jgi:hypothetical protein